MNDQFNQVTKQNYNGYNQRFLRTEKKVKGYKSDSWITFCQARDKGLKIIKGSKSISVFKGYGSFIEKGKDKDGKTKVKSVSRPMGTARVFNLDCTEKYIAKKTVINQVTI